MTCGVSCRRAFCGCQTGSRRSLFGASAFIASFRLEESAGTRMRQGLVTAASTAVVAAESGEKQKTDNPLAGIVVVVVAKQAVSTAVSATAEKQQQDKPHAAIVASEKAAVAGIAATVGSAQIAHFFASRFSLCFILCGAACQCFRGIGDFWKIIDFTV